MQIESDLSHVPFFKDNANNFVADLSDPRKTTKLIAGHVQSGKTAVICGSVVYLIKKLNMDVVVVVRDYTADYKQLDKKFSDYCPLGFGKFDIRVEYAGNLNSRNVFKTDQPCLIICLEQEKQLGKVIKAYKDAKVRRGRDIEFCLIADEADSVCYKKESERIRITNFNLLRSFSSQFIGVTATAFDMLFMEMELDNCNIYHVPIPRFYKGISHDDFSISELDDSFSFKLEQNDSEMWELSSDVEQFYMNLLNVNPFKTTIFEDEKESSEMIHPVICLQKTETIIKKQNQCMNALIRHPVFGKKFTVIVYNGEGVFAYSPSPISQEIVDSEGNIQSAIFSPKDKEGNLIHKHVLQFKLFIGDILQYFKNRGVEQSSHIIIIAGQMVGRGLNICSNDYKWHLTHQLLRISDNATCSDLIQSCRVFGVYKDDIKIHLYLPKEDALSLRQACKLQNEIFRGAELFDLIENMPELCEKIRVSCVPFRKLSAKRQVVLNVVHDLEVKFSFESKESENLYKIDRDDLKSSEDKEYYNALVEYMEKNQKLQSWFSQEEIQEEMAKENGNRMKRNLHHWQNDDLVYCPNSEGRGLFFRKFNNKWQVRFNKV